jgi:hypothetical protein
MMSELRTDERVVGPHPPVAENNLDHFGVEIAEVALILAGQTDDECVETLKDVNEDLKDTGLAVDFWVAVLKRKSELETTTMTSRSQ